MTNSKSQIVAASFLTVALFSINSGLWFLNQDDPSPEIPAKAIQIPEQQESQTDQRKDARLYMKAKLAESQKVMEGLVTENFHLIRDGAAQMKQISEAAHWPTTIDEVYQHYGYEFRRQCDKLVEQSNQRNLQAAHYTYLHMSTTCIDCHNYVRRRFRVERPVKGGPVQLIPTQWDGPKGKHLKRPEPDDEAEDDKGT